MKKARRQAPGTAEGSTSLPARDTGRAFWSTLLVIEFCTFAVHLNGLRTLHLEGDEIIFTFLAERLTHDPFAYHLQGSLGGEPARRFIEEVWEPQKNRKYPDLRTAEVLKTAPDEQGNQSFAYDPAIYDRPLFFHPPVYPYSLALFRVVFGSRYGVLLSAVCHGLTILFVALLGRRLISDFVGRVAAALVAVEAVSWLCGERLWIDGMVEAASAGAMLVACWAAGRGGAGRFAIAGACLGLAGLTKLPAGLLAPAVLTAWLVLPRRPKAAEVASYVATCLALIVPWLILTRVMDGAFFPSVRPTEWLMTRYPYVRMMVNRPASYYLIGLLLASPIFFYSPLALVRIVRARFLWVFIVWGGAVIVGLGVVGASGIGFQLRYLSSAMPALCLLAAAGGAYLPSWCRLPLLPLAAYTLSVGVTAALLPTMADPTPFSLAEYLHGVFGVNLFEALPGMWTLRAG